MKLNTLYRVLKHVHNKNFTSCVRRYSDISSSKSFALSLFDGKVDCTQIFPFPKVLSKEQEENLQQMIPPIVKFFEEVNNPAKNDELETIEPKSMQCLKDLGAFGLQVPEEYGGIGLNNTQYARLVEIVGTYDMGVGIALGAHQSIGFKGILLYGTKEQKAKYLPSLASGKKIAAYCLTEPSAGSDAQAIQAKADKSADGSHYILNGSKLWISNGGIGEIFTVFAKTMGDDSKTKITAFIVDREFGGISHSPPEKKMGIKCSNTAALFFENCKIPAENVLGGEGNGFKVAMNILNNGRFGMAAGLSGTMRSCIKKAVVHAMERVTFKTKIIEYAMVQEKLATMALKQYITESMAFAISGNMDRKVQDFQVEAAISKVYASEAAWYCVDEAIQILGGMGYMKECGLEKTMRDMRIFRIFEGSNDILRLFLVAQGMIHLGKKYKNNNLLQNVFSGLSSSFTYGYNKKQLIKSVHPELRNSAKLLALRISLFGLAANQMLRKHRKDIINQQLILKSLADEVMMIYGISVALSRASMAMENSEPSASYQCTLVKFALSNVRRYVTDLNLVDIHYNETIKSIAEHLVQSEGVVQQNPLGF